MGASPAFSVSVYYKSPIYANLIAYHFYRIFTYIILYINKKGGGQKCPGIITANPFSVWIT